MLFTIFIKLFYSELLEIYFSLLQFITRRILENIQYITR